MVDENCPRVEAITPGLNVLVHVTNAVSVVAGSQDQPKNVRENQAFLTFSKKAIGLFRTKLDEASVVTQISKLIFIFNLSVVNNPKSTIFAQSAPKKCQQISNKATNFSQKINSKLEKYKKIFASNSTTR